jgi:hypothetical protein
MIYRDQIWENDTQKNNPDEQSSNPHEQNNRSNRTNKIKDGIHLGEKQT